jgi:2-succinyl-5-enolpyruvyl-6-hydroxy-3-cyclohexene-1-carboxylate synthase
VSQPRVEVFAIAMRTRFRGITVREGMLLRGDAGWGEFSPFVEYDHQVAAPWLRAAREAADDGWPDPVRTRIPVNVTVPAVGPDQAAEIVRSSNGCRTAKVKVAEPGQTSADEQSRLEAVRDALGPDGRIRIDVNGHWSVDEAVARIPLLDRAAGGLEYVEQPTADVVDLAAVRRKVSVPIAADESIRRAEDPYRVRDLEAADVAVLKVQPLGGVRACLRIAEEIGLPVVVSSALETSIGIAAGLALAAALPELPYACGLATVQLLTDDVVRRPLLPRDGSLPVVHPDPGRRRARAALAGPAGGDRFHVMTPANASTALAAVLVDELVRCGVRDIVLAPGSRSAALAFAAHDAQDRARLHVRVDERSAGFLAVGLARTSRRPVAVVTTSGTAVANLHPAVLEASHAGVPLLLLTADRPARLRGSNANQTTDQVGIFARAVRDQSDITAAHPGGGDVERRQVAAWRALAARSAAVATGALGGRPGPVHLNVQLEEPLVPDVGDGWGSALDGAPHGGPWMTPGARPQPQPARISRDLRSVVVAGDDAGPPARVLADAAGWPLLAEPTSGARTGDSVVRTYRLLLSDPGLAGRIQQVVVFGHPTLSRPVARLLARDDIEQYAVRGPSGWTDSGHQVHTVVDSVQLEGLDVGWFASEQVDPPARESDPWAEEWRDRDADVSRRLDELLSGQGAMTPHHVAGAVSAAVPPGGLLFVGASNPVRDLDLMVAPYAVGDRRMVVGNRGLAGIDGSVSSAVGAALGRPHSTRSLALLGDVTFLHDANGLVIGPEEERPDLTIVVVNDDGGSIFASLEQGGDLHAASYEKLFGTPHGVDVASLCAATRTPHWKVGSVEELRHALSSPAGGVEVVEAVVRRDNRRELDAAIRALVR